jgi:hypothetical protein
VYGVVSNYVALRLKDGRFISLTSYNAAAEKGTPHTRTKPLFTVAQLTTMVESQAWKFPRRPPPARRTRRRQASRTRRPGRTQRPSR